jgi:hypothetical protein
LRHHEAAHLLLQALAAFNRQADVHVTNVHVQGQPAALAIIPGVKFLPDNDGKTTLKKVKHEEK